MTRQFKIGDTVWHGSRYWKMDGLTGTERVGWNTKFVPYVIVRLTAKQIIVETGESLLYPRMTLKREVMERLGKQYHTRFHEYFYAEKPASDPEHRYYDQYIPSFHQVFGDAEYLSTLGLRQPYTQNDARRAYRRLAKIAHPDKGGTSQDFSRLKNAYDVALRFAV